MNQEQFNRMKNQDGFIAALDQSGGSTPGALEMYGIGENQYSDEEEMFTLVHQMRTRIITSPAFSSDQIIGAILFEHTMNNKINNQYTGVYLESQGIIPFIKIDEGLGEVKNGVQLMKAMPNLSPLLAESREKGMFGTKMRSNILEYNEKGIDAVVLQQFEVAEEVIKAGLIPIVEPEVNILAEDKAKIESYLKDSILRQLDKLTKDQFIILKLTIPDQGNLYKELIDHPQVVRVVALSGGYTIEEANEKLKENTDLIASFSRALIQNLSVNQSDDEFNETLKKAIDAIYDASVNKNISEM